MGTTTSRSHSLVDGGLHDLDRSTAREVARHLLDRLDGGGEPDALRRPLEQGVEPLEAEGEVGAALGAGHRVHLVEDDRLHPGEGLAGLRGQHQEQRLGRRDEHVAGGAGEGPPLLGRGVTRAHRHGDVGRGKAQPRRRVPDADQRGAQVALDVDREGLHGRDVEDTAALEPLLGDRLARQPVEGPQEGRQRLAGAGGGHDERMVARADRLPGPRLGRGGRAEGAPEPLRGGGGEAVEHISAGTAAGLAVLGGGHWGKRATRHRQPRDRVSPILGP